jgi:membrane fusion protein (multidrug efflux system)
MKRLSILVIPAIVLLISCGKKTTTETTANVSQETDTTVYLVKTALLEKQKVSRNIENTANLLPFSEINYAPATPGRVEEINVEVGSRVRKGDVVVRMDRTQMIQVTEQLQNALTTYERMDTLHKLHSISEQQYDAAKTQYEIVKSNFDFLNKNTTLVSPINGIVTGKYLEAGELYTSAPNTASGKAAVVTLMQINPLKAKINISEKYFPMVKNGMKAAVGVDVFADKKYTGEVFRIYPTISPETRTFAVELTISNNDEALRPGMFARVLLDLGETEALVVSAMAIIKQEGTNDRYVFIANGEIARKISVQIGDRYDDKVEIISDEIKVGDKLIVAGQDKLMDGSRIKIVQD